MNNELIPQIINMQHRVAGGASASEQLFDIGPARADVAGFADNVCMGTRRI
jgi:hypothetical protein